MEKAKKQFKTAAILVLLFAGLTLFNLVTELIYGDLNTAQIPEGAPENILLITKMILLGFSVLFLLPMVYVGIRGLRIAKNPDTSKRHIVWAAIIFVFLVLSLIEPAVAIVKRDSVFENVSMFFGILLEVTIYFDYIKCARAVAKLAE